MIDDDDDLRETVCVILETSGYQVTAFASAADALAALRDGLRPSLILLDLMMPGITGWGFRAAQLADPQVAEIPVVVMTARTMVAPPGAPSLGDVELVRKPFALQELLAVIARHHRP